MTSTVTATAVQLSPTAPDFQGIMNALEADLAGVSSGSWNNLVTSGTGETLMRWIASVGAFGQGSIARALQESYLDTARSPSGVFRSVRRQGARLIRARPGTVTATVTRTDGLATPLTIPAMTQWTVGGQNYYNSGTSVTLPASGASVSVTLSQGTVASAVYSSAGTPYQCYVLGTSGAWNVGDSDVYMVDSLGQAWTAVTTGGLWQQSGNSAFFESTQVDGTSQCQFGDGNYGLIPPVGPLVFTYATLATYAQTVAGPAIGSTGTATGYAVTLVTTSVAAPNQDPPAPEFYKNVGPGQASNNGRAVNRDDHRAMALAYPGVVDALFRGQAELNPSDLRYMNVLAATLLTTAPWNQNQWLAFKTYMNTVGMASCVFIQSNPTPVTVNVNLNVAVNQPGCVPVVTQLATQVVQNFFAPSNTSLGGSLEPSDLIVAIMESATYLTAPGESGEMIDYVSPVFPDGPVIIAPTQYMVLGNLNLNVFYTTRRVNAASAGLIAGL